MLLDALAIALQVNTPVVLVGLSGVGKSSAIAQLCRDVLGWPCETVITSFRDPSDFGGLPVLMQDAWILWATALMGHLVKIDDPAIPVWMRELAMRVTTIAPIVVTERRRGVRMEAPAWAYRLVDAGVGVVLFDEVNWAPPAVQSAMFRVIQEGWVGDERLPDEIRRVAIMNPVGAGGGYELQAPLANRFVHLAWDNDHMAWIEGMNNGWPTPVIPRLPSTWRELLPKWTSIITSFIRHRPLLLHQFPKDTAAQGGAWASNRTWGDMAIPLLAACDAVGDLAGARVQLLEGSIGQGAATEFLVWERELNLPDPEDLLAHPERFTCPKRPDLVYAVLVSVATTAVHPSTLERWCAGWAVMDRAADAGVMEIACAAAKLLGQQAHYPPGLLQKKLPAATMTTIHRFRPLMDATLRAGGAA